MTRSLVLLYCTDFLERVAYYAFMLTLSIQFYDRYDTPEGIGLFYKMMFAIGTLCALLGGFFGDLTRNSPLFTLIGLGLNLLGFVILALGIPELAKTGILIVIIGSGLFKPNIIASLYATTREKRAKFEGFYLISWLVVLLASLRFGGRDDDEIAARRIHAVHVLRVCRGFAGGDCTVCHKL